MNWKRHGITQKQIRYLNEKQKSALYEILEVIKSGENIKKEHMGLLGVDFNTMGTNEVCRAFDVSAQAITKWKKSECPQNIDKTFSLIDLINWQLKRERDKYNTGDLSLKELNTQKDIELKDVKINKEKGNYILRSDHNMELSNRAKALRMFLEETFNNNYLLFVNLAEDEARMLCRDFNLLAAPK